MFDSVNVFQALGPWAASSPQMMSSNIVIVRLSDCHLGHYLTISGHRIWDYIKSLVSSSLISREHH